MEIGAPSAAERTGNVLGRQILRYRGAEWFQTIDLMLQEERMVRQADTYDNANDLSLEFKNIVRGPLAIGKSCSSLRVRFSKGSLRQIWRA